MRLWMAVAFIFFALFSSYGFAQDKIVGAVWTIKIKNEKTDKFEEFGTLRCTTDGKVFREGKVIGSHKKTSKDSVEMLITESNDPKFNGKLKASLIKKDGTVWGGVFTRDSDGKEFVMSMTLKRD